MENTYEVVPSDGKSVAILIGSFYVNRSWSSHSGFIKEMLSQREDTQYNFTLLCMDWFRSLTGIAKWCDDRNRASVLLGEQISKMFTGYPYREYENKDVPERISVNYDNGTEVAQALVLHLMCSPSGYEAFINAMLQEHHTLQQSFSRLCVTWLKAVAEREKDIQTVKATIAKRVSSLDPVLPFI